MADFRICSINECGKKNYCRDLCYAHYERLIRAKAIPYKFRPPGFKKSEFDRLRLIETDGCVNWSFDKNHSGHGRLNIKRKWKFTHRIVAEEKLGKAPTEKHFVAHNCGNASCLNYKHLRWATAKENENDKILHGTRICGEKHYKAKLTEEIVKSIRKLKMEGVHRSVIAEKFNIAPGTINDIVSKRTWAHIIGQ